MHAHCNKKYMRLIYNTFLKIIYINKNICPSCRWKKKQIPVNNTSVLKVAQSNKKPEVGYLSMSNKRLSSSVYCDIHVQSYKFKS